MFICCWGADCIFLSFGFFNGKEFDGESQTKREGEDKKGSRKGAKAQSTRKEFSLQWLPPPLHLLSSPKKKTTRLA
jgi:hypothetical protein